VKPEQIVDATMTRPGRDLRRAVVDPMTHETWRALIRDTYPSTLDRVGPTWIERYGREIDWTATEVYAEARREDWARRTVRDAGQDWATHMAKFSGAVLPRQ
jgi:hypothetical protein